MPRIDHPSAELARARSSAQLATEQYLDLVRWIAETGYPLDWATIDGDDGPGPIPEHARAPLAAAWMTLRAARWAEAGGDPHADLAVVAADWCRLLADEGGWPRPSTVVHPLRAVLPR